MAPKKGISNNPNGRPKGSKNVRTLEWEEIKEAFITTHTARANRILTTLEDEKFMDSYLKLLEYFKPKLARTEVSNHDNSTINVNVVWDSDTEFVHTTTKAALKSAAGPSRSEEV